MAFASLNTASLIPPQHLSAFKSLYTHSCGMPNPSINQTLKMPLAFRVPLLALGAGYFKR